MVIAVNTSFTTGDLSNGDFIFESFSRIAQHYPQHQFIYIFDTAFDKKYITSQNIMPVITGPPTKNPLLLQYRLNYKIPSILRRHKADVFISTGGYCSVRTKVPQCIIISDISFLHHPEFFTKSWLRFYKNNTVKFLGKAKIIIPASHFLKNKIVEHYKIQSNKIDVVHNGIDNFFKPVTNQQQKDNTKAQYTGGKEYFLYSGPIQPRENLMLLLKAFSFFKKRQKSNMQLVLASKLAAADKALIKSLATFKYREEVKLLYNLPGETLAQITASAYAIVCPSFHDSRGASILEAMQSGIPVIVSTTGAMPEICGNAALYINSNDFNDIAEKMMTIFKDEDQRNQFIIKGRQQAAIYSWDKTANAVWEAILKCADPLK